MKLDSLPRDTAYFHARYRQEHPAVKGRDYLIADLEGRGHYVGTVISVTLAQDGWFGEGDDFFFIDGEEVPSLQGTGSEDYFNDAWGFRPRTSHWFGQPRWQGDNAGDSGVAYRWHVLDPVASKSRCALPSNTRATPTTNSASSLERPDFFSSVAFWYQTGEPKVFGAPAAVVRAAYSLAALPHGPRLPQCADHRRRKGESADERLLRLAADFGVAERPRRCRIDRALHGRRSGTVRRPANGRAGAATTAATTFASTARKRPSPISPLPKKANWTCRSACGNWPRARTSSRSTPSPFPRTTPGRLQGRQPSRSCAS